MYANSRRRIHYKFTISQISMFKILPLMFDSKNLINSYKEGLRNKNNKKLLFIKSYFLACKSLSVIIIRMRYSRISRLKKINSLDRFIKTNDYNITNGKQLNQLKYFCLWLLKKFNDWFPTDVTLFMFWNFCQKKERAK